MDTNTFNRRGAKGAKTAAPKTPNATFTGPGTASRVGDQLFSR
jgi:hypothetical protein